MAAEVTNICENLQIEDANETKEDRSKYNKKLKESCRVRDEVNIKKKMEKMEKMDTLKNEDCKRKDYINQKSINTVRNTFATRVMMLRFAGNFSHDDYFRRTNWQCEGCDLKVIEDQVHIASCTGYEDLRRNKNIEHDNEDLVTFFQEVLDRRDMIAKNKRKQK